MLHPITLLLVTFWSVPSLATSRIRLPVVGSNPSDVAITSMSLTDQRRVDPFTKDGRARRIMVSGFSPVSVCRHSHLEAYMPPSTANFEDEKFAAYGLPNGTSQSLGLKGCTANGAPRYCSSKTLPLVLFSGALGTSRTIYHSMLQSVAAAGYFVVSVDHPYDADIVEFPNGTIITGVDINDAELDDALTTRVEDIAFLYQELAKPSLRTQLFPMHRHSGNLPKTAIIGHSFGGATAAAALQQLSYIRGGVNIDGTMFGSVLRTGLNRPFMLIGHENKTQETDPSWKTVWPQLKGWKKEVEVKGAAHYSFSDLPLITSVLGLQDKLPAEVEQVLGSIEGYRMMKLTVAYVTAFLNMALKSGSEGDFVRADTEFSEVVEVS
ncbi:PAF acetylhydrolase family protein [Karstenula rhodostoma CBS 690.94]|uniref:1-alkyl-2-acetylglycerophosphocholine esterase n=1 Tax=Karstenula rhodostoma CBS 690.94 TaxID=1392251 RepID=A0A9P4PP74_9PLEO|nr:PAF acetylhydrolase family protein [Karstenula rhodostoma CBS 690.94]